MRSCAFVFQNTTMSFSSLLSGRLKAILTKSSVNFRRKLSTSSFRSGKLEDHYATLGVTPSADPKEIKIAFYCLSKQYHPDLNPGDRKAEERFKAISAAYNILGDAERKRVYDFKYFSRPRRTSNLTDSARWSGEEVIVC